MANTVQGLMEDAARDAAIFALAGFLREYGFVKQRDLDRVAAAIAASVPADIPANAAAIYNAKVRHLLLTDGDGRNGPVLTVIRGGKDTSPE